MISYPHIDHSFRKLLTKSKAIGGRFYIAPKWATELNSSTLETLVADLVPKTQTKKYPLAVMMPPAMHGDYTGRTFKETVPITIMFLKQSGKQSNGQVQSVHRPTGTTGHSTLHDWHDMKRVAMDFMQALSLAIISTNLKNFFILSQAEKQVIVPISNIANDNLSGVMLTFAILLVNNCPALEDYDASDLYDMTFSEEDTHPQHPL